MRGHLQVHSLDPLEAWFSIAGAEYTGREQEFLGDLDVYIHVSVINLWDQLITGRYRVHIYACVHGPHSFVVKRQCQWGGSCRTLGHCLRRTVG